MQTVKILERPDGSERVVIVRRADGNFTYQKQWREITDGEVTWDAGLDLGIYDSPETAEQEARLRTQWLRAGFQ